MTLASWPLPRGLDPGPAEARGWLEQELRGSTYQSPWLRSAIRWVVDHVLAFLNGAGNLANSGLSPVITVLVALVVIALLVWVLPRVRRESAVTGLDGPVLEDLSVTARTYRDRAARALRDGHFDDAALDGFRAIAKDMSDRTLLDDAPGRTAHEVSLALAQSFPGHAPRLARVADAFDSVRYGHRAATSQQAVEVRDLDGELVKTRPRLAVPRGQDLPV